MQDKPQKPNQQEMEALAKLVNSNHPGWQALEKWLEWEKQHSLDFLSDAVNPVEIHRAQGSLGTIGRLVDDINGQIKHMRKQA